MLFFQVPERACWPLELTRPPGLKVNNMKECAGSHSGGEGFFHEIDFINEVRADTNGVPDVIRILSIRAGLEVPSDIAHDDGIALVGNQMGGALICLEWRQDNLGSLRLGLIDPFDCQP